jgi:hypothetical protein
MSTKFYDPLVELKGLTLEQVQDLNRRVEEHYEDHNKRTSLEQTPRDLTDCKYDVRIHVVRRPLLS